MTDKLTVEQAFNEALDRFNKGLGKPLPPEVTRLMRAFYIAGVMHGIVAHGKNNAESMLAALECLKLADKEVETLTANN